MPGSQCSVPHRSFQPASDLPDTTASSRSTSCSNRAPARAEGVPATVRRHSPCTPTTASKSGNSTTPVTRVTSHCSAARGSAPPSPSPSPWAAAVTATSAARSAAGDGANSAGREFHEAPWTTSRRTMIPHAGMCCGMSAVGNGRRSSMAPSAPTLTSWQSYLPFPKRHLMTRSCHFTFNVGVGDCTTSPGSPIDTALGVVHPTTVPTSSRPTRGSATGESNSSKPPLPSPSSSTTAWGQSGPMTTRAPGRTRGAAPGGGSGSTVPVHRPAVPPTAASPTTPTSGPACRPSATLAQSRGGGGGGVATSSSVPTDVKGAWSTYTSSPVRLWMSGVASVAGTPSPVPSPPALWSASPP